MNKPTEQLKERLKKALDIRNLTQQELSERTQIPKSSISQYLSGYAKPKDDRVYAMAVALDVNEAWLLGFDVPMNRGKYLQMFTRDSLINFSATSSLYR